MRRKELGIDRGRKIHSRGVTKGDTRQSERASVIMGRKMKWREREREKERGSA